MEQVQLPAQSEGSPGSVTLLIVVGILFWKLSLFGLLYLLSFNEAITAKIQYVSCVAEQIGLFVSINFYLSFRNSVKGSTFLILDIVYVLFGLLFTAFNIILLLILHSQAWS